MDRTQKPPKQRSHEGRKPRPHGKPAAGKFSRFARAKKFAAGGTSSSGGALAQSHGPIAAMGDVDEVVRLFGLHPVAAALDNPQRTPITLYATENAERRLNDMLSRPCPQATRVSPRDLDRVLGSDTVHQGVLLDTTPLPEPDFRDLAANANGRPLIVLDQVTDPHNVGAILRSAAVFGASGLIMTRRHSPPLNGVLAKSASGALELIPVALVGNLARGLEDLRDAGFHLVGLDGTADVRLETLEWHQPIALVLGAEGKGLRELTRKTCDTLARITTDSTLASLNVSNAAAVALHTAALTRLGS